MSPATFGRQGIVRMGDVSISVFTPAAQFDPSVLATRNPCLVCERAIGEQPHLQVTIWSSMDAGCECGQLAAAVYLMHETCDTDDIRQIMELAQVQSMNCPQHKGRRLW